jgi:hypothetical protein
MSVAQERQGPGRWIYRPSARYGVSSACMHFYRAQPMYLLLVVLFST